MPYITQWEREELDSWLDSYGLFDLPVGRLNYIVTRILLKTKPENYRDYNALVGVLTCVLLEFYRRVVAKYEDSKCEVNGEVYRER